LAEKAGAKEIFDAAGVGGPESVVRGLSQLGVKRPAPVSPFPGFFLAAHGGHGVNVQLSGAPCAVPNSVFTISSLLPSI
jgi:hypothetical protein